MKSITRHIACLCENTFDAQVPESADLADGNSLFETVGRWQEKETASQMRVNFCSTSLTGLMNDESGGAAGTSPSSTTAGANCEEHTFVPLGHTTPVFVLGDYLTFDRPAAAIHYLTGHKPNAEDYALAVELATPFVSQWFGAPRRKAVVAELADPQAAPFESGSLLLTPLNPAADSRLVQMTAVH